MFKKTLLAVGLSLFAAASMAATEGTDYVKLEKPMVNAEGKLTKIFSYDCPFCFKYDVGVDPKVLPRIEKETGLAFNPIHLETKGKYGRIGSEFLAMCLLRDKVGGRDGGTSVSLVFRLRISSPRHPTFSHPTGSEKSKGPCRNLFRPSTKGFFHHDQIHEGARV